jgi:hypothetical protein
MKMRWWMAILLLLNAMALAWQWDAFGRWGWGPNVQREPERLNEQIKPEILKITLPGQEASAPASAVAPASEPVLTPSKAATPEASPAPAKPTASTPTSAASAPVTATAPTAPSATAPANPASK